MSPALEIQKAIYARLREYAPLTALLAAHAIATTGGSAVYDQVPQDASAESKAKFPYVSIGEHTETEFDGDDFVGRETTFTVHTWSRHRGFAETKQIQDAMKDALHEFDLQITGQHLVLCQQEYAESTLDPDGVTRHGVSRFRLITIGG